MASRLKKEHKLSVSVFGCVSFDGSCKAVGDVGAGVQHWMCENEASIHCVPKSLLVSLHPQPSKCKDYLSCSMPLRFSLEP
jgi:hypothetical protein